MRQCLADRFEIRDIDRDFLGRGSMVDVYRATDTHTGEPVAMKALDPRVVASGPGIVERFVREGQPIVLALERTVDFEEQHFGQTVLVVISYREEEADPATVGGGGNTRWHEHPRVEVFSENETPSRDTHIPLARLVISEGGTVSSEPDNSVRKRAGVRLGGEAEVRQLILARDGVDSSQWPALSCSAAIMRRKRNGPSKMGHLT